MIFAHFSQHYWSWSLGFTFLALFGAVRLEIGVVVATIQGMLDSGEAHAVMYDWLLGLCEDISCKTSAALT
jgi:hypothetical protein